MAEFTADDKKNLKTACEFIIRMEPIISSVGRHDAEIRNLQLEDVSQGGAIAGVKQDVKTANSRITDMKRDDREEMKAGGKSWENAFWKVFATVVTLVVLFLNNYAKAGG